MTPSAQNALEHALCCRAWVERKERQGDTISAGLWRKAAQFYETESLTARSLAAIEECIAGIERWREAYYSLRVATIALLEDLAQDPSLLCCSVPRHVVEGQQQGESIDQPSIAKGTAGAAALSRRSRHLREKV